MQIKEISTHEFDKFALKHPLGNYHQTSSYALIMAEYDFDYDCIAYLDYDDNILAAALILHKKIGMFNRYGYSPKGFLIDYTNKTLLKNFTEEIIKYYNKKGFAFIKINPEIVIGEIINNEIKYNPNTKIKNQLETLGYKSLKRNLYFESMLPRFNAILPLKNYNFLKVTKQTRNKIKKSFRKGLEIKIGNRDSIDIIYEFIKNKKEKQLLYYKDYYNVFSKNDLIDVILVKINFKKYLLESKKLYEKELEINTKLSENLVSNATEKAISIKMQSDINLAAYKEDMIESTKFAAKYNKDVYIAGALIIKYQNRINIFISGYDKNFDRFAPNYFLHHNIFEYYKDNFDFADLNGITGDFSKENPYYGLNKFKEGFKPFEYEFIGEFDLVINQKGYNQLLNTGALSKEFIINKNKKII